MNWIFLRNIDQINTLQEDSATIPQVIFKHSTRCSISSTIKNRLERSTIPDNVRFYYLDLILHRTISNKIAEVFNVPHASPQILLIKNGNCIYNESHMAIDPAELITQLKKNLII